MILESSPPRIDDICTDDIPPQPIIAVVKLCFMWIFLSLEYAFGNAVRSFRDDYISFHGKNQGVSVKIVLMAKFSPIIVVFAQS